MKLRIRGNSLRLRLTRSEVARLSDDGSLEEASEFGSGEVLRYGIETANRLDTVRTSFQAGSVRVSVSATRIRQWAGSDEVGIYGNSGTMEVAIEKDFRCLTRPDEQLDPDVYPHPAADSEGRHTDCDR